MPVYITWLEIAVYVLAAVAIFSQIAKRNQTNPKIALRILAFVSAGLCLCCFAWTMAAPQISSPRKIATGRVIGFHQVRAYRSSSFHFQIARDGHTTEEVHANYFDKGFYFGDPAMSDGDMAEVAYLEWTKQAFSIRELSGRHAGWSFSESPETPAPLVMCFLGIAILASGLLSVISDIMARPDDQPPQTDQRNPGAMFGS